MPPHRVRWEKRVHGTLIRKWVNAQPSAQVRTLCPDLRRFCPPQTGLSRSRASDHCVLAALLEYGSETNWVACMIPTPSGVGTETR